VVEIPVVEGNSSRVDRLVELTAQGLVFRREGPVEAEVQFALRQRLQAARDEFLAGLSPAAHRLMVSNPDLVELLPPNARQAWDALAREVQNFILDS
jgi:hypothetical protein